MKAILFISLVVFLHGNHSYFLDEQEDFYMSSKNRNHQLDPFFSQVATGIAESLSRFLGFSNTRRTRSVDDIIDDDEFTDWIDFVDQNLLEDYYGVSTNDVVEQFSANNTEVSTVEDSYVNETEAFENLTLGQYSFGDNESTTVLSLEPVNEEVMNEEATNDSVVSIKEDIISDDRYPTSKETDFELETNKYTTYMPLEEPAYVTQQRIPNPLSYLTNLVFRVVGVAVDAIKSLNEPWKNKD